MNRTLEVDLQLQQGGFALDARFAVPGDGISALFGPSGAGKSTLLAAIAGLRQPKAGRIRLGERICEDRDTKLHLPPHRRGIGLVFQDARLFPHLTVRQNIRYASHRAPPGAHPDVADLVKFFDIASWLDRPVSNLSGGEKSRVALARALASSPDFLLLDEPFAALDGARRRDFIQVLLAMHRTYGLPMLVVTHNIDDAAALASHLVVLDQGRVAASGHIGEIARRAEFRAVLDSRDIGAVLPARFLRRVQQDAIQGLWLRADHVLLAAERPNAISARNIIEGRIGNVSAEETGAMLVELETSAGVIVSRVTAEATRELALAPGMAAWAIVKAHAI